MSYEVPPGFEPHDRKSPLTAPWKPIYCKAEGTSVALGVEIREPHTNSRGLVHGGLVAALLDNVMGLACSKALLTEGPEARSVSLRYRSESSISAWRSLGSG